jgi:hypothetical protein
MADAEPRDVHPAPSLARWLAVTMLPLALLLVGFAAIEPRLLGDRDSAFSVQIAFCYHYSALAACYVFGLHWVEHRRLRSALRAALLATTLMALVTICLFYVGFVFGWITAGILEALLPHRRVVLPVAIGVPAVAGAAWGFCLASAAGLVSDFPASWIRLLCVWGAITGPPMLLSQTAFRYGSRSGWIGLLHSPYGPVITTMAVALLLGVMHWWWLRRCRRRSSAPLQVVAMPRVEP